MLVHLTLRSCWSWGLLAVLALVFVLLIPSYIFAEGQHGALTGVVSTVATGNGPSDVAVDQAGNAYFVDAHYVRKIDTLGNITIVAGNGTSNYAGDGVLATNTGLFNIWAIAIDTSGNLYFPSDTSAGCRVHKVDSAGIITTIAGGSGPCPDFLQGGGGPATSARFPQIRALVFDAFGNLYMTSPAAAQHPLIRVDTTGTISNIGLDDILAVVDAYFKDDNDGNRGLPPYVPGYNPDTDRTLLGPLAWSLGPPNGLQRVDDILNAIHQYSTTARSRIQPGASDDDAGC